MVGLWVNKRRPWPKEAVEDLKVFEFDSCWSEYWWSVVGFHHGAVAQFEILADARRMRDTIKNESVFIR